MKKFTSIIILAAAVFTATTASATTTCNFVKTTKLWKLQATCATDETLVVPKGVTVDGQGFTVRAVDPAGGNFQGPIFTNGGATANFQNLVLRTNSAMADFCSPDGGKLIGILLNRATSTISNVNITMNKAAGASLCDEGVGIRAESLPYDSRRAFNKVTIKGSIFNYNQKAAVEVVGNINFRLETTQIKGDTDQDGVPMTRRGVHVGEKAKAYILNNEIIRFINNTPGTLSNGVYLENAGQTTVYNNIFNYNDVAILVNGGTKITVRANTIRSSTNDGILFTDTLGVPNISNTIWANSVGKSGTNGIYIQSTLGLTTKNIVKENLLGGTAGGNDQHGLVMEGSLNKAQKNNSTLNSKESPGTFKDIANAPGAANLYSQNVCTTSTGLPVNCGS